MAKLKGITSPIQGSAYGTTYRIEFEDHGGDTVVLVIQNNKSGEELRHNVPRGNAIEYQNSMKNDLIDSVLRDFLTKE